MSEPWTLINIDGHTRPLRFNGAALRDFEMAYARSIGVPEYPFGKLFLRFYDKATQFEVITSYNLLAHLLWAGLKWQWRTLTVEKALDLVSDFEEKGGDLVADVWGPIQLAWAQTGMFKKLVERAEKDQQGNAPAELEVKTEEKSPSNPSGSATGTDAQPA